VEEGAEATLRSGDARFNKKRPVSLFSPKDQVVSVVAKAEEVG
jgi:hypothetical protein